MIHVAILKDRYIDLILGGTKTVESRLLRTRSAPFGRVAPGERIFFKASGGGYRALAIADAIDERDSLSPAAIHRLRREVNERVCAPVQFWSDRLTARYAVLITLSHIVEFHRGPRIPAMHGRAWLCLPDSKAPRSVRSAA